MINDITNTSLDILDEIPTSLDFNYEIKVIYPHTSNLKKKNLFKGVIQISLAS